MSEFSENDFYERDPADRFESWGDTDTDIDWGDDTINSASQDIIPDISGDIPDITGDIPDYWGDIPIAWGTPEATPTSPEVSTTEVAALGGSALIGSVEVTQVQQATPAVSEAADSGEL
jgi:hypothetical protein